MGSRRLLVDAPALRACTIGLALLGVGCRPPFVQVAVEDPANVADGAVELRVGAVDGGQETIVLNGRSFPLSLTLTADEVGERRVAFEARAADGAAVGRARAAMTFATDDRLPTTVELRKACDEDAVCDNGAFCDGAETCDDGLCAPGAPPCPASDVECVAVACAEDADACDVALQHELCGYPDERRYCDREDGCQDGVVCTDASDCDNTIECDGLEECVDEHCEPGPPVRLDDGNPCTLDTCREIVGVEHTALPDGSPCPFSGSVSFDGTCRGGECVERQPIIPPNPFLRLLDETTGSPFLTQQREVGVQLYAPLAVAYLIAEGQSTPPADDDERWALTAPETFLLSEGFGKKTVYVWVMSEDGLLNPGAPPAAALIRYTDDVVRIGPTPTSCPVETGGACDFSNEDGANPLQMAADAAAPDQTLWLYPSAEGEAWPPVTLLTERLTLAGAPGFVPRDTIVIENTGGVAVRALGAGAVVRDLHLRVIQGRAIEADSDDALFERLYMEAPTPPSSGGGPRDAILGSRSHVLRDSFVWGWFHGLETIGAQPGGPNPQHYQIVHNTVVQWRGGAAVGFNEGCIYEAVNNVFVNLDATNEAAFRAGGSLRDGTRFASNLVWGWGAGASAALAEREVSVLIVPPGLLHMMTPEPGLASPALDAGETHPAASTVDLFGDLRAPDGAPDMGAVEVETPTTLGLGALGAVRVGPDALGCPLATAGPCDVVRPDAGSHTLQDVFDRVPAGTIVELFGDPSAPTRYRADNAIVSRTMTLRRSEDVPREAVVIAPTDDASTALRLLQGTGIVIDGLDFECTSCTAVDVGQGGATAADARLSRLRLHAIDSQQYAFELAIGSHLWSSVAWGAPGGFVRLANASTVGVRVINNTFHSADTGLTISANGADARVANNVFVVTGAHDQLTYSGFGQLSFEFNQLYGYKDTAFGYLDPARTSDDVAGTNCVVDDGGLGDCAAASPGFAAAAAGDFTPTASSPLVDAGDDGELTTAMTEDLIGAARSTGAAVDVGALERP